MTADFHKTFDKQFAKLSEQQKRRVRVIVEQFLENPTDVTLRNHPLKREWSGHRSISAGGDLRSHYFVVSSTKVLFVAVGTHSQLYK
ncbi:MAG: type II toxin-antitoxin system mRNA interferase toxin, RelE/StbE family [Candidatus Saccharimonadales bacterium]